MAPSVKGVARPICRPAVGSVGAVKGGTECVRTGDRDPAAVAPDCWSDMADFLDLAGCCGAVRKRILSGKAPRNPGQGNDNYQCGRSHVCAPRIGLVRLNHLKS